MRIILAILTVIGIMIMIKAPEFVSGATLLMALLLSACSGFILLSSFDERVNNKHTHTHNNR